MVGYTNIASSHLAVEVEDLEFQGEAAFGEAEVGVLEIPGIGHYKDYPALARQAWFAPAEDLDAEDPQTVVEVALDWQDLGEVVQGSPVGTVTVVRSRG